MKNSREEQKNYDSWKLTTDKNKSLRETLNRSLQPLKDKPE